MRMKDWIAIWPYLKPARFTGTMVHCPDTPDPCTTAWRKIAPSLSISMAYRIRIPIISSNASGKYYLINDCWSGMVIA